MPSKFTVSRRGFTLIEMMISTAIVAFGLTGAYMAIALLGKGSESMIFYSEMNHESRTALYYLGRDARAAPEVVLASPSRFQILDLDGVLIDYEYDAQSNRLTRTRGGNELTILDNVTDCQFSYYTLRQALTNRPIEVKHVQLQARMERAVLSLRTSDDIVTARFMMRNHEVSN